jgi:integral membrane protein
VTAEPTTATSSRLPHALARRVGQAVPAALVRYRVMAWIVGVLLIALVLVAVPLKHLTGVDEPVAVIGTAHGWLYAIFFVTACDLALRARWSLRGEGQDRDGARQQHQHGAAERIATRRTRSGQSL